MRVVHAPGELEVRPRAVALGTFDGVHLGHRRVLEAAAETGLTVWEKVRGNRNIERPSRSNRCDVNAELTRNL